MSCEATGDYEVTFTLNAPNSTFINTIATTGIVPEHAYSDNYANEPIGSGLGSLSSGIRGTGNTGSQ